MNTQISKSDKERLTMRTDTRQLPDNSDEGRRRLRLLIVEDYDGFRESLQIYFEYFGYIVGVADCYKTAIKEAERNPPDVLICDWHINGPRDGTEVARKIYTRYHSTIIFVSGSSLARLRAATLDLSEAHYFEKPASLGEIEKIVKTVEQRVQ